jgi:hypothetical protein
MLWSEVSKHCNITGYTYDNLPEKGKLKCYTDKNSHTCTNVTVTSMTRRVNEVGHTLYTDNFLFSPDLFDDLHTRGINCCGSVSQNHK